VPDVPVQRVAVGTSGSAAAHRSAPARRHAATDRNARRTQLHLARPSGSFAVPAGLFATPAAAAHATAHPELLQAALALLGLVATSGCFLAVAARSRREEAGA
jgi:hypothetical protein